MQLRGDLYLLGYTSNELEIRDLEKDEVVDSMAVGEDGSEPMIDLDFCGDEQRIVVGFRSDYCALVDMKRKTVNKFEHYLPHPLCLVQTLRNLPGFHFFTVSKGGVYRVWGDGPNSAYSQDVAKFHPS